jgi:L-asparaginase II
VDPIDVPITLPARAELERPRKVVTDRPNESLDLLTRQSCGESKRRQPAPVQDLVGVRAADTRDRTLVAEERMELALTRSQDRRQPIPVQLQSVRSKMGEIGFDLFRRRQPDAGSLLLPGLGQHECAAACEAEAERRPPRPACIGVEKAQPAGSHQVDAKDELPIVGGEEDVLPPTPRTRKEPPFERGERRVNGFERGNVRRSDALDTRSADERIELTYPRLDLGQLRHLLVDSSAVERFEPVPFGPRLSDRAEVGWAVMKPIVVEAVRGTLVEARHRVHAVAVQDGTLVAHAGDPALVAYLRSSAKPLQVLPAVRARPDLDEAEIAIACASHLARAEQLEPVRSLLAKAPADEEELECGSDPTPIEHNCSGKHAAMLALCRAMSWPSEGYRRAGHPCQRAMLAEVAAVAEVDPETIPTAIDGCGVLTFGLTLERMSHAFSRLLVVEGGRRVLSAMQSFPELIRGPLAADTMLMRALPGWGAKGGAEGLLCAVSPDGLAITVKVEDGNTRAVRGALASFLATLGFDTGEFGVVPLENSRGEIVGRLQVV